MGFVILAIGLAGLLIGVGLLVAWIICRVLGKQSRLWVAAVTVTACSIVATVTGPLVMIISDPTIRDSGQAHRSVLVPVMSSGAIATTTVSPQGSSSNSPRNEPVADWRPQLSEAIKLAETWKVAALDARARVNSGQMIVEKERLAAVRQEAERYVADMVNSPGERPLRNLLLTMELAEGQLQEAQNLMLKDKSPGGQVKLLDHMLKNFDTDIAKAKAALE